MHSFLELSKLFEEKFNVRHFPVHTASLYDPAQYILGIGGKRIRPVCVLLGNELFDDITTDAYYAATAIELFHNFSLIHDDIMDKAPVRRGMETVHIKYGESTALLAGDVMFVKAYEYLNKIEPHNLQKVLHLFNVTASQVCEGQQLDMDFEKRETVSFDEYMNMITLKTSVLVAASLQLGAILGGAGIASQQHLYEFGKNLGIAFQVQDDYLDAFGDPEKFGKQIGGDIIANKKTFLMLHAMEVATGADKEALLALLSSNPADKVQRVLDIFKKCKVDEWAKQLKDNYYQTALQHLEDTAVVAVRKKPLLELSAYLMVRES
ncbi:MAG: polyprenyl synthetase family protein [Ferruginibacter sp.]